MFAVVKAGGYGHGAVPVAHAALEGGASGLAVATLEEATQLGGLIDPEQILVMGGVLPSQASAAASTGCSIGVSSREVAEALAGSSEPVPVHLKIDTGRRRRWPSRSRSRAAPAWPGRGPISRSRSRTRP